MFNPHTKFEVSTITCNEEMKGNAKCKNSRFEPPFGGLRGNEKRTDKLAFHLLFYSMVYKCAL